VLILHGDEACPSADLGRVLHLGELPGPHARRAEVPYFSGLDEVVQGFHGFLDRGVGVEAVDLIEVDVVGFEPGQRRVDLFHDRSAGQAGPARTVVDGEEHLGGQHDVVTAGEFLEGPADHLFRGAVVVSVGGVPEGDTKLECLPEERGGVLVRDGSPFAP